MKIKRSFIFIAERALLSLCFIVLLLLGAKIMHLQLNINREQGELASYYKREVAGAEWAQQQLNDARRELSDYRFRDFDATRRAAAAVSRPTPAASRAAK